MLALKIIVCFAGNTALLYGLWWVHNHNVWAAAALAALFITAWQLWSIAVMEVLKTLLGRCGS